LNTATINDVIKRQFVGWLSECSRLWRSARRCCRCATHLKRRDKCARARHPCRGRVITGWRLAATPSSCAGCAGRGKLDEARSASRARETNAHHLFELSELLLGDKSFRARRAIVDEMHAAFQLSGASLLLSVDGHLEVVASSGPRSPMRARPAPPSAPVPVALSTRLPPSDPDPRARCSVVRLACLCCAGCRTNAPLANCSRPLRTPGDRTRAGATS